MSVAFFVCCMLFADPTMVSGCVLLLFLIPPLTCCTVHAPRTRAVVAAAAVTSSPDELASVYDTPVHAGVHVSYSPGQVAHIR